MSAQDNAAIFDDFDMVVSVSLATLNDQLRKLTAKGVIPPRLLLTRHLAANNTWTYQQHPDGSAIPRDADGNPTVELIDAAIVPQIAITSSGTDVTLVIGFEAGEAWLYGDATGPLAQLTHHNAGGWTYAVGISLDLAAVKADDLGHGIAVPSEVEAQLSGFLDQMFRIDHLFLDFDSVDLLDFDATKTVAPTGGEGAKAFTEFMQFFLTSLVRNGNPFILGYSLATTDQTASTTANSVPASLRPSGTTFSIFHDPSDPSRSSVNFVLVTDGGHRTIMGSPPNFSSNWFDPDDKSAAKLIYSSSCLEEPLLLRPVFEAVRDGVYKKLAGKVSVSKGNAYADALRWTATGPNFDIAKDWSGNDRFINQFEASYTSSASTLTISFTGVVKAYKFVEKTILCKATASASGESHWSGTISVTASGDSGLQVSHNFETTSSTHDSDSNTCAKDMKFIGNVLGGVVDVFTLGLDGGFFGTTLGNALSVDIPGVGDLDVAMNHLAESVANVIVLPAGDVFDFSHPTSDVNGNLALDLTYR